MNRSWITAVAVGGVLVACAQKPAPTTTPAPAQTDVAPGGGMNDGMGGRRGGPGGGMGRRMDEMLFSGITLTTDQRARIDSIRATYRAQNEGLDPRNNPADRDTMRQRMQAQMTEIRAVLTTDQQAVFDRNVADMRSRMRGGADGPPPGGAPPV